MNDHASRRIAVVIGAGGGLGAALVRQASQNGQVDGSSGAYRSVLPLGRHTQPPLDYTDEASLAAAARWVAAQCAESGAELRLLVVGSGFLHGEPGQPERSWAHLDAAYLNHVFAINTIGPALVMKHFLPLLPKCGRVRGAASGHGRYGAEPAVCQSRPGGARAARGRWGFAAGA